MAAALEGSAAIFVFSGQCYSFGPATFPRKTVIEAAGKVNEVCGPAATVVATGG